MAGTKLTFQAIDSSGNSGGGKIIKNNEKNEVKDYLLGQMDEADAEQLELRLLTDPAFGEEFDTIVDELTDEYVGNELQGEERKRVEQYFLRSTERQNKVRFANELLERAAAERGQSAASVVPVQPGILERVRLFWASQSFVARFASSFAAIVIVLGVVLLAWPGNRPTGTYALVKLTMSSSERSEGPRTERVRLEPGSLGVRIEIMLPDPVPPAKSYRVELLNDQRTPRNLPIEQQTDRMLVVTIPADQLKRESYVIHLHYVTPEGNEQRVPGGSYFFSVQ